MVAILVVSLPISWLVPEGGWLGFARLFTVLRGAIKRDRAQRVRQIEQAAGSRRLAMAAAEAADLRIANVFVERLQMLRCHRPGGWNPSIRLEGRDHLDRAMAAGNGAVLWSMPSSYSRIVAKIALHRAGFPIHYLSRYTHDLSESLWGARILNPIRVRVENRYLAERFVIWPGTERETFKKMEARLGGGALVGITVSHTARRFHDIPFLDGRLRLATAPAALAIRHCAPLIPFTTEREADGGFVVRVQAPLIAPDPGDLGGSIESMLSQYGALATAYALRRPDQFWWQEVIL